MWLRTNEAVVIYTGISYANRNLNGITETGSCKHTPPEGGNKTSGIQTAAVDTRQFENNGH